MHFHVLMSLLLLNHKTLGKILRVIGCHWFLIARYLQNQGHNADYFDN